MNLASNKQLVAVDIDEVLAYHNQALAEWHNKEFGTQHTSDTYTTDYWSEVWGVTSEEADIRADAFHASGAHARLKPIPGAAEALRQLNARYDLAVVTVRRKSVIGATQYWINTYYPDLFRNIHFLHVWDTGDTTTKAELCQKIGARYLIDDSLKHCTLASQSGINAILFGEYAWNSATELPSGVRRAGNWNEVGSMLT